MLDAARILKLEPAERYIEEIDWIYAEHKAQQEELARKKVIYGKRREGENHYLNSPRKKLVILVIVMVL